MVVEVIDYDVTLWVDFIDRDFVPTPVQGCCYTGIKSFFSVRRVASGFLRVLAPLSRVCGRAPYVNAFGERGAPVMVEDLSVPRRALG